MTRARPPTRGDAPPERSAEDLTASLTRHDATDGERQDPEAVDYSDRDVALAELFHPASVADALVDAFPELGLVHWHRLSAAERRAWYEQPQVQEMLGLLAFWHSRLSRFVSPPGVVEGLYVALRPLREFTGSSGPYVKPRPR